MRLTVPPARVDALTKGLWHPGPAESIEDFAAARHHLFGGAFTWPVMVARRSALDHNIDRLAAFCAERGLEFAPHGKTTMAPSLFQAQFDAGAWGITAATANQVLAYRTFGVPRVLLANELLDPVALRWIGEEIDRGLEFLCYVDSVAGVETIASVPGSFRVLVELGHAGGRTGCRTAAELTEVARAVAAAPNIELAGVAAYEGGLTSVPAVTAYLNDVRAATLELSRAGLLPETVIVTAGGSAYFDVVADRLGGEWLPGHRLRTILRSGAYVSHDDGVYRVKTPYTRIGGSLDAALEVWAQVTSTPEEGLALVGMGKREAPYDEGLPVPRLIRRRDGSEEPADGLVVERMNDHHAYLTGDVRLTPGDLVCFGISHPCTAFDKWQVIPVIDEDRTVVDLIRTYF
ncbi:alanine racemase [Actinoallomurus soli]|uniref:alanine racemase n=1 Tax=Actinoallomurus soli TaxID=2952535 RepID=UPI002093D153|nr:alanine racemase [Actinoallomurus soli]MCO5970541.1 alanine racemase [Actinoallomurus soli]